VLAIGTPERPDPFVRDVEKSPPLHVQTAGSGRSGGRRRHPVERCDGFLVDVAGHASLALEAGYLLRSETPGGGGPGDLAGVGVAP
jgi:hypothetical protein